MSLFKDYIDTDKPNVKIRASISFNRNTRSWTTGQAVPIGYRVTCVPVEITDNFESFGVFTGFNDTLLEVNRQSSKRLLQAIEIYKANKSMYIDYFKQKGYNIKEEV